MIAGFLLTALFTCVAGGTPLSPAERNAPSVGWPAFRGPLGTGMVPDDSISAGLALHWSELEHVTWKTSIPHSGLSTPVIQDGKVWLTTATLEGHESFVLCVDATTGKMLLNKRLFETANPEPLGNKVNGYASPSPVAELGHVYINFGSCGTACLDATSFTVLWKRTDLPCRHYRGPGSSPILFRDLLIVTMDGVDQQYVVALNKATGETVWKTDRTTRWDDLDAQGNPDREGDKRKAYSTPLVASVDGTPLLISVGSTAVFAYDPFTGREIWKFQHKDFSSSISPVFGHDLAFIGSGFGKAEFFAMRVNGQGPLTEEAIVWKAKKGMPRTPSPLLVDDLVYTLADNGTVTCMDALTGQEIWQERLEGQFAASLLHAKGCIYCCNQEGQTTVLQAGRSFKVLATNRLDFGCMASPAVADNALFLRTKSYLYRIDK